MCISQDDQVDCTEKWVSWYGKVCKENNIRPWILYFPLPPLVSKSPYGVYEDSFYKDAPDIYGDTSIRDILSDACEKYNVSFIDATETLMNYTNKVEPAFYRWAPHPTEKGYGLVGELAAEKMIHHIDHTGNMKDKSPSIVKKEQKNL